MEWSDDKESKACEQRGSNTMDVAVISGATFTHKAVTYYAVDGVALFEGDIALGPVANVLARTETIRRAVALGDSRTLAVGLPGGQFRWPSCVMPYSIDPGLPAQERVHAAIDHWSSNTAFRFVARTPAN